MPRKPPPLRVVEDAPARAPRPCAIPETPCLVAVDNAVRMRGAVDVRHNGGDTYEIRSGDWLYKIGPVKLIGRQRQRAVTATRQRGATIRGVADLGGNDVDLDGLAAVLAVCGATVAWAGEPPVWWPHGGGKV